MSQGARSARAETLLRALDQRVAAAAQVVLAEQGRETPTWDLDRPGDAAATLLPVLVSVCPAGPSPELWLVSTAVAGAFPSADELQETARVQQLGHPDDVVQRLLDLTLRGHRSTRVDLEMDVVSDRVVLDADFCGRDDKHTGIQRVTRETARRWLSAHGVVGVVHTDQRTAYRRLAPREDARVFRHGEVVEIEPAQEAVYEHRLVVPWRTTVVCAEVPHPAMCTRLGALAQFSGSRLSLIAHDLIPILSPHARPLIDAGVVCAYLHVVKRAHRVAGVSRSAAAEFRGFTEMLPAQGLTGPDVRTVGLPEVAVGGAPATRTHPTRPVVVLTGSREPHKNMRAALHAAERLWADGLDFEVVMIGGHGWDERLLNRSIRRLRAAGHPLRTPGRLGDEEMWRQVRDASFVVFASLHEGYGLPVAEALACGTPVITSNYGAQQEIADGGGCVTVDPRDDDAILAAMRSLITDPTRLEGLRAEIARRPARSWDDYTADLWTSLVETPDDTPVETEVLL